MEQKSVNTTKSGTLPPIDTKPARKAKKSAKISKTGKGAVVEPKVLDVQSKSTKLTPAKDLSAAHPAMIGVDIQSLHPFSSELIDGLYKRPVVVSMLVPKKKVKNFKYEPSKRAASPTNTGEESDGQSGKRSLSRPSSRSEPRSDKKKSQLKVFVIKVYDLVESKEGVYSVVVREYDKLLEDLILEEGSTAVCDYFQPQSLDWWAKSLRHVLITFDKPNGELSVVVDKKLIRKMVTYNMTHHVWMKANLTAEQIKAAKLERSESMKKRNKPAKRKSAADMELIMQELPWNDYTAMGERNPPPVQRAGTASSSSKLNASSVKSLPPVSRPKSPAVVLFEVGDWVQGNFKRAGQWYPGIVKKVYNHGEYYDLEYDDGRAEVRVEAKLVRKSGGLRSSSQFDSVDLLSSTDFDANASTSIISNDPAGYDYGDAFSPGAGSLEQSYDSAYESGAYESGAYDSAYESAYESTNEGAYEPEASIAYGGEDGGVAESSVDLDASQAEAATEGAADAEGVAYDSYTPVEAENTTYIEPSTEYTTEPAEPIERTEPTEQTEPTVQTEPTEPSEAVPDEYALTEADYHIDDEQGEDRGEDYNNHAYDYTNQAVIDEEGSPQAQPDAQQFNTEYTSQEAQGGDWEVADGAELSQHESDATQQAVEGDVYETTDAVASDNYPEEAQDSAVQDEHTAYEYPAETPVEAGVETEEPSEYPHSYEQNQVYDATNGAAQAPADNETNTGEYSALTEQEPDAIGFESEVSDTDFGSPEAKKTPSQVALRSLLQSLALEESSLESGAQPKSKKGKKKGSRKIASAQPLEGSSTSLILGTESVASVGEGAPNNNGTKPRTAGLKIRKIKPAKAPEGLFPASGEQRGKTAGNAVRPPNIEEYVARAAVSPPKIRANTSHKATKSKKTKPKSAKPAPAEKEIVEPAPVKQVIYGNGLAKLGKPATAPVKDLHRGITFEGEEGNHGGSHDSHDQLDQGSVTSLQSVHTHDTQNTHHSHHSHHSHNTHHSYLSRGPHHHGPDAHGNFDHSDLPHYPYPHHTREEQKKLAIEAITKPHSNPTDRYTYVMMPAPLHMLQPVHGHGHDGHHGHHGHHGHGHGHHGEHSAHSTPHSGSHPHHGHSHHPHHSQVHETHGEISPLGSRSEDDYVHHTMPFEVRNILDQTMLPHHHHDFHGQLPAGPAHFSETFHSGHTAPSSPDKHHAHANHTSHSNANSLALTSSSLPTLPHIHRTTQSRPTSGSVDPHLGHSSTHHAQQHSALGVSDNSVAVTESSSQQPRPQSKSKARAVSPFAHKNRYKGPQRRVLDIIEWARVSTGGSEQKQNRKISKVEKRLLKSPLALKLIVDSPLNVADLIEDVHKR